ncbi:MAG: CehA/McbA family metallohydrolase [Acidobacteria bacterium]|nr:CehA/McbA family metallohydrolase [Acidobacteriota bacterium]
MSARRVFASLVLLGLATSVSALQLRYPELKRLHIRVEMHLVPAVSSGPLDPAWSPDGHWLAFSMRGDIWKVPAGGGDAIALTQGPGYHFEPAWSPDGSRLALSVDRGGNLDIGLVSADGGPVERLTDDPHLDVQPVWSADGKSVYFASARTGDFNLYRVEVATREVTPILVSPLDQFHPALSPDGRSLAFVGTVEGQLGTGGIWVMPLDTGVPTLAYYEETNFRAKPAWSSDGRHFVYVTDITGTNDIAIVPARGGNPTRLTWGALDELAPAVSPDGSTIAYVSNRSGPPELMTIPIGGGTPRAVTIDSRRSRTPTGRIRGRVVDASGRETAARIQLLAADGRAYAPDDSFHRVISASETHYFASDGTFEVEMPAGEARLNVLKGFEYTPARATVLVPAGGFAELTVRLDRLADPPASGWYSGDTHVHDTHAGRWGLTTEHVMTQVQAEDLRMTNILVHMDDTRVMGNWSDVIGRPHPVSTSDYVLYHGEEFRGSLGHVGLLGIKELILPVLGGVPTTAYASDVLSIPQLDEARRQGGIVGFLHPFYRDVSEPGIAATSEFPLLAALGKLDFYDVVCIWSDEMASAEMYYRALNSGFRIAATGGSDTPSNVWRAPPPGTGRTYARVNGRFTSDSWLEAVKAGRTFATNGPLLFLEVDGRQPGEEIRLTSGAPALVTVRVQARSMVPLERVEIIVNGRVTHTETLPGDARSLDSTLEVAVPGSGWIAARAVGAPHAYVADTRPFAQTSAVHVVRDGRRYVSTADARFLMEAVEAMWKHVAARDRWTSNAQRETFRLSVGAATEVYRGIVESGR